MVVGVGAVVTQSEMLLPGVSGSRDAPCRQEGSQVSGSSSLSISGWTSLDASETDGHASLPMQPDHSREPSSTLPWPRSPPSPAQGTAFGTTSRFTGWGPSQVRSDRVVPGGQGLGWGAMGKAETLGLTLCLTFLAKG